MTAQDRRFGVYGSSAVKVPCRVATSSSITLAGLQTIGAVTLAADDRVLVKSQTNAVDNGIYVASTGTWARSKDFNGPYDVVQGTLVYVIGHDLYELTTTDPVIGTSALTFIPILTRLQGNGLDLFGDLSTPSGFTAALNTAADYIGAQGGGVIGIPAGEFEYEALELMPTLVFTATIATPCVCTKVAHGLTSGATFVPTTDGALPTGLTFGATYYVEVINADTFYVSATSGGARIATSGSQSGIHTGILAAVASADEGYACMFTAQRDNITIRGAGKGITVLKPTTNKITGLLMLGATSLTVEDLTIDNGASGILTNQVQASPILPGCGIAGEGNGANCGIRVGKPGNITVRRVDFTSVCHCIHYIGDWEDDSIAGLDYTVDECTFDDFVFGVLALQYRHGRLTRCRGLNGVDRIDFGGNTAAGHLHYGSNRNGAEPISLVISDIDAFNCMSDPLKARKGLKVTWTNIAIEDCGRGMSPENLHAFTLSNFTIKLKEFGADGFRSGLHLSSLANYEISNGVIDRSGCDSLGVQWETGTGGTAPQNKNGRMADVTVIDDLGGDPTRPAFLVEDQTDLDLEGLIYRTTANVVSTGYAVELRDCTRVNVVRPKRRSAEGSNPSGSALLVLLDDDCDGCTVEWARSDIHAMPVTNTVRVNNSDTIVTRVDGSQRGTWVMLVGFDLKPFTVTIASPAVISLTAHGLSANDPFIPTTSGALPTGITAGTTYYVKAVDANSFKLSATPAGADINTTGTQSGAHILAPGDFVPTYTTQAGWWRRTGDFVTAGGTVEFDSNAYVATTGDFGISGHGFTAAGAAGPALNWKNGVGEHQNIDATTTDIGVVIYETKNFFNLRSNETGGAGDFLNESAFPASTSGFVLGFQSTFRIVET